MNNEMTIGFWYEIEGRPFANENTKMYCRALIMQEFWKIVGDEELNIFGVGGIKIIYKNGGRILDWYELWKEDQHYKIQLFSTIGIKAVAVRKECSIRIDEGVIVKRRGIIRMEEI